MNYREHAPTPALAPFVRCFWSVRFDPSHGPPSMQRVLPDGCMDVIFSFGDEPVGSFTLPDERARLVGSMTFADRFLLHPGADLFGVRFRPGAAAAFVRVDAHEVLNSSASLRNVLGRRASQIQHELADLSPERRRTRLSHELSRLQRPMSREQAIVIEAERAIDRHRGRIAVETIAEHVGVGRRRLERAFAAYVGHGPKVACRIQRLAETIRIADARPSISQARLALDAGYFDQAHMIREVRTLAGATPGELIAERQGVAFVQSEGESSELE
jgi:AraC-like DNA-binding protein